MTSYQVRVSREGDQWLGEVPGLPGGHAFGRTLSVLRRELADAILLADDLPDDAEIAVELVAADGVPPEVAEALSLAVERHASAKRQADVTERTKGLVRRLVDGGYSVRDVAGALDLTPGRISQLAKR